MRCAVFIGLCLAVLALSEARSFNSKNLRAQLVARFLKKETPSFKAGLLSKISAKRSQQVTRQPEGDLIASANEIFFGVGQIINDSVWMNVPEGAWDTEMWNWCQFEGEPWYDNIYMQAALGAIGYVKVPELRPLLDWVYRTFSEAWECNEMQSMGQDLREKFEGNFEGFEFVRVAIEIMESHCNSTGSAFQELLDAIEEIECEQDGADTRQVERQFFSSQKRLSRKQRSYDGGDNSEGSDGSEESDGEMPWLSRHMFYAIQMVGQCLLDDSTSTECLDAEAVVRDYINGLVAESKVWEAHEEYACDGLGIAVSLVAQAIEADSGYQNLLVDYLDFQSDFENLVHEACGSPPTDRSLNRLKELLRDLLVKK